MLALLEQQRPTPVCQLLRKLRVVNPGKLQMVVLDNTSYQRANSVHALAQRLRIRLLLLPPYSPIGSCPR